MSTLPRSRLKVQSLTPEEIAEEEATEKTLKNLDKDKEHFLIIWTRLSPLDHPRHRQIDKLLQLVEESKTLVVRIFQGGRKYDTLIVKVKELENSIDELNGIINESETDETPFQKRDELNDKIGDIVEESKELVLEINGMKTDLKTKGEEARALYDQLVKGLESNTKYEDYKYANWPWTWSESDEEAE